MSEREAYVAWYVTEFGRHPIDYGYESHVTWKAWQAAQAVPKCDHVMATNTIKWDDRTQKEGPFCIKCGATQLQEMEDE